ncbi:MAG: DnaA N-terminal domain-containing protein, partial [Candidatus Nanoarchaeia archaeon]
MTNEELWQAALGEIELNLSPANFITWFKNTGIIERKSGIAVIGVPNGFSKEWLANKYYKLILKALRNIAPDIKEINFIISSLPAKTTNKRIQKEKVVIPEEQIGFDELQINKETNLNPK